MRTGNWRSRKKLLIVLLTAWFGLAANGAAAQQYKGLPVTKNRLINVLRSKSLQTREIVAVVKNNGVDFELSAAIETELTAAGARPAVIEAVRGNYRSAQTAVAADNSRAKTQLIAGGEPLTQSALTALLNNRVTDAQIQKSVKARGVAFQMSPVIAREIKAAGGSDQLIGLLFLAYIPPHKNSAVNNSSQNLSAGAVNNYDQMIDSAVDLFDNKKDRQGAVAALQRALKLDAASPRAYQTLGYISLYGSANFVDSEKYMREAIARGGSAVFRVKHDHNGTFLNTCQGSLYVAKDSVRFESDDNRHTFDTPDANIKTVKMNSSLRRMFQTKSGSYKIVLNTNEDNDSIKFSFAPLTNSDAESKMVIRLIGKNQ